MMSPLNLSSSNRRANKRKSSLSHKLLLWLSLVVSFVLSVASFSNYLYLYKEAQQIHQQRAEQYLTFLSETIELPLWGIDNPVVQKIGQSFAKNEDVGFMRIQDDQGRVIFEKPSTNNNPVQVTAKKQIIHDNMVVGTVELGIGLSSYQTIQHQLLIVSIATMLLLIVFLFIVVRLLFNRLLEQPLNLLIQRTKDMAVGHYHAKIDNLRYREFDVIADSLNYMADQVLSREEILRENNKQLQNEIAERLKVEQELTSYQDNLEELIILRTDELQKANNELAVAKDIAEAASQAKSDFLASMSHEIRTPMNAILGMLYLALKMEIPPVLFNYLNKAHGSAQLLLGIINDILDFSKIEAGRLEIEAIEFNFSTVLEELIDTLSFQAGKKGIEFLVRHNFNIPTQLIGDPLRLRQILLNLCSNAIKFTEAGEVELSFTILELTDTVLNLKITVRDTGIGISPEMQQHLFQKFTQEDQSTTRRFGGTGLGLAISKHLVDLMGGDIWVDASELGRGTTICCNIPFKIDQQSITRQQELLEQTGMLVTGIRALVVDDNEISCEILAGILRTFSIDVCMAHSGVQAIELVACPQSPFDIVIMDWRMPGMTGDEATRYIRANANIVQQPKIIMVTAYGRENVMNLAQQAGVDGFLVKPISPSILLDTILSVLGRQRVPSENSLIMNANQAINANSYVGANVLLVEDNEINREFAVELLSSMGIHVDQVINGEQALQQVQQRDYDAVLMDIQMPVMDGLEATKRIRALGQQQFAQLPIIAMTAMAMKEDVEKCLATGMTDYVSKPIMPEQLFAVLAKWVVVNPARLPVVSHIDEELKPEIDFSALASFNVDEGIQRIGGKAEAYRKQLYRFREHYANAVAELQQLVDKQELMAARAYCHALKGVTGNLGAHELFVHIDEIDCLLKQNQRPSIEQFAKMEGLLQSCINEINSLTEFILPVAKLLRHDELLAKLGALITLLDNDLGAASFLLEDLQAGVVGTELESDIQEIVSKVDIFELDEAVSKIDILYKRLHQYA